MELDGCKRVWGATAANRTTASKIFNLRARLNTNILTHNEAGAVQLPSRPLAQHSHTLHRASLVPRHKNEVIIFVNILGEHSSAEQVTLNRRPASCSLSRSMACCQLVGQWPTQTCESLPSAEPSSQRGARTPPSGPSASAWRIVSHTRDCPARSHALAHPIRHADKH